MEGKINFYTGDIQPCDGIVFVFGSNPVGINGNPAKGTGGAALTAQLHFGVRQWEKMDNCMSQSGKAYGLTTVAYPGKRRSISKEGIIDNVRKMYGTAAANPSLKFMVAYRNTDKASLNGYTGLEMIDMFLSAGEIPDNVYFSEEWMKEMTKDK